MDVIFLAFYIILNHGQLLKLVSFSSFLAKNVS